MNAPANATTNAIEVEHLTKRFGELVAVNEISFTVSAGEIFGLLGPNGAGKTTLIRMLTTLTPATSGTALTARETLTIHAKLYGVPAARRGPLADELLAAVDLEKFAGQLVRNFSGGMRRRLEIARGLVHSPKILFLDEPTTGLDPVSRSNVWEMIAKLKQQSDLTILLTTHYMDEADKLCDRIAIVDHGKLAALDTPTQLKDNVPGTAVVEAAFTGAPANWVEQLRGLAQVADVKEQDGAVHIASHSGPDTVGALMELAKARRVTVKKVTVQSTTLDDVFLHYTGRQLRDTAHAGLLYDVSHLYK